MGIRTKRSTGTRFPAHTVKIGIRLPAPAKNLPTLVGFVLDVGQRMKPMTIIMIDFAGSAGDFIFQTEKCSVETSRKSTPHHQRSPLYVSL